MSTNILTVNDPYAQPSLLRQLVTPVLYGMNAVLPKSIYDAIYKPAFKFYQVLVKGWYKRRLAAEKLSGSTQRVVCMERVLKAMDYSLVAYPGLECTHDLAAGLVEQKVQGSFVECGVAQGGCASLLATVAAEDKDGRVCWFFDSYEGLPDATSNDYEAGKTGRHIRPLPKGSCLGTYEQVKWLLFDKFGFDKEKINMVKGWFQDTLPKTKQDIGPIAFLRVDGDWYESTMCCLSNLFEQVTPNGCILIDDYHSCFGARKATDEFISQQAPTAELHPDGRGGAYFFKT